MKSVGYLSLLMILSGGAFSPASALDYEEYPSIRLRSLDKITARTLTFDAQVGNTVKFGDIYIKIQSCRKPPPVEKNEASAFMQIWQVDKSKSQSRWIFSGWMFSSSPALSGMDHPVYDVWVIDCLGKDPEALPVNETKQDKALPDEGTVPEESVVKPDIAPEDQKEDQKPIKQELEIETQSQIPSEQKSEQPATPQNRVDPESIEGIY